jgi:hypothetical protein
MRFRCRLEVWFEADDLDHAQATGQDLTLAVVDALGSRIVRNEKQGGLARTELEPADDEARAAFEAADLGPGIISMLQMGRREDPDA